MNKLSRCMVYPTFALALTAVAANAEAIHPSSSDASTSNVGLSAVDSGRSFAEITISSLSETSNNTAPKPSARNDAQYGNGYNGSVMTPETKVMTFETLQASHDSTPSAAHASSTTPEAHDAEVEQSHAASAADPGAKDSGTDNGSQSTGTGAQIVAEASANLSTAVDPTVMTIATTDPTVVTSSDTTTGGTLVLADPATAAPEPSSLILVGSLFVAFGMFKRNRKQQA